MCRDGAQSGPSHFSRLNAPFLCPLHLSKAQIPSKSGQITRKAQYSRLLQNWHAPCNKQYISSFGGPGTGRPGEPLFYLQHRRFWGPRYRQAGHPPLYAVPLLGTLVQAGRDIPSFIRAVSLAPASAQRPLHRPIRRAGGARPPPSATNLPCCAVPASSPACPAG